MFFKKKGPKGQLSRRVVGKKVDPTLKEKEANAALKKKEAEVVPHSSQKEAHPPQIKHKTPTFEDCDADASTKADESRDNMSDGSNERKEHEEERFMDTLSKFRDDPFEATGCGSLACVEKGIMEMMGCYPEPRVKIGKSSSAVDVGPWKYVDEKIENVNKVGSFIVNKVQRELINVHVKEMKRVRSQSYSTGDFDLMTTPRRLGSSPPTGRGAASPPRERSIGRRPRELSTVSLSKERGVVSPPRERRAVTPSMACGAVSPPRERRAVSPSMAYGAVSQPRERRAASPSMERGAVSPPRQRSATTAPVQLAAVKRSGQRSASALFKRFTSNRSFGSFSSKKDDKSDAGEEDELTFDENSTKGTLTTLDTYDTKKEGPQIDDQIVAFFNSLGVEMY